MVVLREILDRCSFSLRVFTPVSLSFKQMWAQQISQVSSSDPRSDYVSSKTNVRKAVVKHSKTIFYFNFQCSLDLLM